MFPRVTGIRFAVKIVFIFKVASWSALNPEAATIAAVCFAKMPLVKKNIFAILCSYPDATKVIIGKKIAKKILLEHDITIEIDLDDGTGSAVAWGCDLTYDYVKINGDYRT